MYAGGKDLLTQARTQNDLSLGQGAWWMCEMHLLLEKGSLILWDTCTQHVMSCWCWWARLISDHCMSNTMQKMVTSIAAVAKCVCECSPDQYFWFRESESWIWWEPGARGVQVRSSEAVTQWISITCCHLPAHYNYKSMESQTLHPLHPMWLLTSQSHGHVFCFNSHVHSSEKAFRKMLEPGRTRFVCRSSTRASVGPVQPRELCAAHSMENALCSSA